MQKRKAYFETFGHKQFSHCIPAVGQGLRKSWGTYNIHRKHVIANQKKSCENWSALAKIEIKFAWHCRKLRLLTMSLKDLSSVLKFQHIDYNGKEINWMRKISRCLKRSLEKQVKTCESLASQVKARNAGIYL